MSDDDIYEGIREREELGCNTHLGAALGRELVALVLGTMNFGELTAETASFEIMDSIVSIGVLP